MAVITYTAVNRGFLVGGHTATTSYQIETTFQGYPINFIPKGEWVETLDGTQEGYLHALQREYAIQTDFIALAARPDWREFFTSVMNRETFQVDFTGTITFPGTDVDVALVSSSIQESQLGGVGVQYSFVVKVAP